MPGVRPVLLCLVIVLTLPAAIPAGIPPAGAQSLSGGSEQESARPGLFSDLMDAIDSGSRMLIGQIQPQDRRDLVENPRFNSQESPRHALMTLMEAMALVERGYEDLGYRRAMASLPDGASQEDARRLNRILLRIGPVSPAELPGAEQIEQSGDSRYEYFPRGMDHRWLWDRASIPPDAEIALVRQADGRWLFSRQSVDGAPALLDAVADIAPIYDHGSEGQYFLHVFSPMIERTSLVGWLGFFLITAVGVAAGIGVSRAGGFAARWLERRDRDFLGTTVRGLGHSGGILVFTVIFTVAVGFIELGPVLQSLRYTIPRFLVIIAMALMIMSLIDVAAAAAGERIGRKGSHYDRMVVTVVRRILRVFVIALILIFILQNLLGFNGGALLVGFGFIALALSLAAQDTVKNLFGAVSIFVNRPFVIGDWIIFRGEMGEHIGHILDIELQSTKLEDLEGNLVTLPNMLFIDREVQNLSARGHIRRKIDIAIPYRADAEELDRALQALEDVFGDAEVLEDAGAGDHDEEPHVSFYGFADSWLTIRGYHYYFMGGSGELQRDTERGWFTFLSHCSLVNRKIVQLFGERDIEFDFPTQTVALVPQAGEPVTIRQDAPAADDAGGTDGKAKDQSGDESKARRREKANAGSGSGGGHGAGGGNGGEAEEGD